MVEAICAHNPHPCVAQSFLYVCACCACRRNTSMFEQMGVDTSRTEHIKIAVDITFPALPCHGELRPQMLTQLCPL